MADGSRLWRRYAHPAFEGNPWLSSMKYSASVQSLFGIPFTEAATWWRAGTAFSSNADIALAELAVNLGGFFIGDATKLAQDILYLFSGRLPRSLKRRECHFLL